jgi:hypothetical protein
MVAVHGAPKGCSLGGGVDLLEDALQLVGGPSLIPRFFLKAVRLVNDYAT